MTQDKKRTQKPDEEIILLEDLAPLEDVSGGAGRLLFGQEAARRPPATRQDRPKDPSG
jgi:hypothetical protein